MLLMPIIGISQTKINNIEFKIGYGESSNYVQENSDGSLEIKGDSLTAIIMLFQELKKMNKEIEDSEMALNKSVQWSNSVSDYFKKNKYWYEYLKAIKKQGYKLSIKKN